MPEYGDIPLPKSDLGRGSYRRGRALVEEHGLGLERIVWDADEVLWDWVMDAGRILRDVPALFRRSVGHREWMMVKPGVFELIWGMRHASLEAGESAYIRVWTNGYPWRLWRIAREIPGFAALLGSPADDGPGGAGAFRRHPRIFSRLDFVEVARRLVSPSTRRRELASVSEAARRVIGEQFRRDPYDSSLKIPELAALVGKEGFAEAEILVDDQPANVRRFAQTGRRGVRVVSDVPRVLFGSVPNTVWRAPVEALRELSNDLGDSLADALQGVAGDSETEIVAARPSARSPSYIPLEFAIDVPDERLRSEWIAPMRALKRRGELATAATSTRPR